MLVKKGVMPPRGEACVAHGLGVPCRYPMAIHLSALNGKLARGLLRVGLAALVMALSACGPGLERPAGPQEQPRGRKIVTVAILGEVDTFFRLGPGGGTGGANNVPPMVHDTLVVENDKGIFEPRLVAEQISVEKGTWRGNSDGTMDTVWKLRQNILWHDGVPFTSADLLFMFDLYMNPLCCNTGNLRAFLLSASAPDPLTFTLKWSVTRFDADRNGLAIMSPVPEHLVGELYRQGDWEAFENNPRFTTEFVGLGPYRLANWERGSHMELTRFDDYHLGRPPLDGITVRFMNDPNAMVSSILAGVVDVVLPRGVLLDAAVETKRLWEGTGNQVRLDLNSRLVFLEVQHRPEYAVPRNGFTNAAVRQAFYHAIDRKALVEVSADGLAPVADGWIVPTDALYPELNPSTPRFPYDPNRALALLGQVGWVRGVDGVLVNNQTGNPFQTQLWGSPGETLGPERSLNVIASDWKGLGGQVDLNTIPVQRSGDREHRALHPGAFLTSQASQRFTTDQLHSTQIPTAASRWGGFNRGGYNSPRVDAILDMLTTTITPQQRLPLHRQLLQEQLGDVAIMPLYWDVVPTFIVSGIRGPVFYRNNATWNLMEWQKE